MSRITGHFTCKICKQEQKPETFDWSNCHHVITLKIGEGIILSLPHFSN
jgi:hypothetical protein